GADASVQDASWYVNGPWGRSELAPADSASLTGGVAAVTHAPWGEETWWAGADGSVRDAFAISQAVDPGAGYIQVEATDGGSGSYQVGTDVAHRSPAPPVTFSGGAANLTGTITGAGDMGLYEVDVPAPEILTVDMTAAPGSSLDSVLSIWSLN